MKNAFICSNCNNEQTHLIVKNLKNKTRHGGWYYLWLVILFIPFVVGIGFIIHAFQTNIDENLSDAFLYGLGGIMICFFSLIPAIITLLIDSCYEQKIESEIFVICPHCGKTWKVQIGDDGIVQDIDNKVLEINKLKEKIIELENNTKN